MYRSFVSLGRFIPKYFILFIAVVNGIVSLISLSVFSLLVYRNARDFCVLIGKGQFSFQSPKKGNSKECSNYCTVALISHASKIMLKILQERLQQYVNWEIPNVQIVFRKVRGTRNQIANICWIIEKAREFQKNIYFYFIDYVRALTVWITANCGKFFKRLETRPPDLPPEKSVCGSRSNS